MIAEADEIVPRARSDALVSAFRIPPRVVVLEAPAITILISTRVTSTKSRRSWRGSVAPDRGGTLHACGSASTNSAICRRVSASGSRPLPPPRLSTMCLALLVAGVTTVTAG